VKPGFSTFQKYPKVCIRWFCLNAWNVSSTIVILELIICTCIV